MRLPEHPLLLLLLLLPDSYLVQSHRKISFSLFFDFNSSQQFLLGEKVLDEKSCICGLMLGLVHMHLAYSVEKRDTALNLATI